MDALRPERHLGKGLLHVDDDEGGFGFGGGGHFSTYVDWSAFTLAKTKRAGKAYMRQCKDKKSQTCISLP